MVACNSTLNTCGKVYDQIQLSECVLNGQQAVNAVYFFYQDLTMMTSFCINEMAKIFPGYLYKVVIKIVFLILYNT